MSAARSTPSWRQHVEEGFNVKGIDEAVEDCLRQSLASQNRYIPSSSESRRYTHPQIYDLGAPFSSRIDEPVKMHQGACFRRPLASIKLPQVAGEKTLRLADLTVSKPSHDTLGDRRTSTDIDLRHHTEVSDCELDEFRAISISAKTWFDPHSLKAVDAIGIFDDLRQRFPLNDQG